MTLFDRHPHGWPRHSLLPSRQVPGQERGSFARGAYKDYILSFRGPLCKYLYSKQSSLLATTGGISTYGVFC